MEFKDRISAKPGRIKLTDDSGNVTYYTMEKADEPTQEGTPINAAIMNTLVQVSDNNDSKTDIEKDIIDGNGNRVLPTTSGTQVIMDEATGQRLADLITELNTLITGLMPKNGGTFTGDITAPNLQLSEVANGAGNIATISNEGQITYRTPAETKSDIGLGNVTNTTQMPISGGTFTGTAHARNANVADYCLRDIFVGNSSWGGQSTARIVMLRK